MKIKKITITIFLLFAVLLCSCSHYYYMSNIQNVPLFKEKNECRLSLAAAAGEEISGTEVQGAYSVTDNFAIMTNFMLAESGDNSKNNWGKGNYIDGAIGYYKPLDEFAVFEIYGGFGASKQHHQYANNNYNNGTSDLSFTKLFLQPSIGLTFNAFDIALSTRICNLSFFKIDNQIDKRNSEFYYLDTIAQNRNSYLLETALTIRGGWKYVKVQLQFGGLKNFTNPNLRFETHYGSISLYITIAKRYGNMFRKKTDKYNRNK
ncbi:MAG: hypothetical protein V1781_06305 [Bacteroidota bacterium]